MSKVPNRIMIYAKDVQNITGLKRRTANAIMQKIRTYYNKKANDFITIIEFCGFYKLDQTLVREFLVD